jgi:micrococcal nuclease
MCIMMFIFFMNIIRRIFCRCASVEGIDHDYLNSITYEQTQPFIPQLSYCKVIKVYDGDTVTVGSRITGTNIVYRFSVRLAGIDTPEMTSKNNLEKERAIFVRDRLHDLVFGKIVLLKNLSTEKYGRILADIYLDDLHINKYMIDNKYAYEYNGGKKQAFAEK